MSTPAPQGRNLAAEIIDRWTKAGKPDTLAALEQHPELRQDKAAVLDLAFAEYWLRLHFGESLDIEAFCRRFPEYYVSLNRLLAQQSLQDKDKIEAPPAVELDEKSPTIQVPLTAETGFSGSNPQAAKDAWPAEGIRIGDFKLVRSLGKGAFSRVYIAVEETVGRSVVVKLSKQQCDEAKVLGRLGHQNVVSVLSAPHDATSGLYIIVMPYHGNSTLEDLIELAFPFREDSQSKQRPRSADVILQSAQRNRKEGDPKVELSPDTFLNHASYVDGIVWLGVRMAEALSAVHRSGFIHHDLKPSNVLLGLDAQPRLLDFNLATDARNTKSRLGGTLPYMPPEHLQYLQSNKRDDTSTVMDQRGDIFSLGVMLYELLTGTHPFGRFPKSKSVRAVANDILARQKLGVRPIHERNPDVPQRLAKLIDQCLSFDVNLRPATAHDVVTQLQRCYSTQKRVRQLMRSNFARTAVMTSCIGLATAVGWMTTARAAKDIDHAAIGHQLVAEKDYCTAASHFQLALEQQPNNPALASDLAKARLAQRDYNCAKGELQRAVELNPNDLKLMSMQAWNLCQLNSTQAAEELLTRIVQQPGAPAGAYTLLAFVHVQRRHDAKALSLLNERLIQQPNDWVLLANLVHLQQLRAMAQRELPSPETFKNVVRLVANAPSDPQMYLWAARFYAWAITPPAGTEKAWSANPNEMKAQCLAALKRAVEAGLPQNAWRDDTTFRTIFGDSAQYAANWNVPKTPVTGPTYWRSGDPLVLFP